MWEKIIDIKIRRIILFIFLVLVIVLISSCSQKNEICGNGVCETKETYETCCTDCGCNNGYTCVSNNCFKSSLCGNGICEKDESSLNCCQDCGCERGSYCSNNVCQSSCGDGKCNNYEDTLICPQDCINNKKENIVSKPKVDEFCGDGICQENDGQFCLDCPIECKNPKLCNGKIDVYCKDCSSDDEKLLSLTYDYQNEVYACLTNFFSYQPERIITYDIEPEGNICEGIYCEHVGTSGRINVNEFGFVGLVKKGDNRVNLIENLKAEIHETTHVFNYYAFGAQPSWFDEGVAIWTNTKVNCHPKQLKEVRISDPMNAPRLYELLKSGEMKVSQIKNPHDIGSIFFVGLETDYNCDKNCILTALRSLKKYRQNCDNSCLANLDYPHSEFYKEFYKENLMIPIINNKIIKEKFEETSRRDLTPLFALLNID